MKSYVRVAVAIALLVCVAFAEDEAEHENKLRISTLSKPEDCSRVAKNGDKLSMHYRGTLLDGTVFDESYKRGQPFSFVLGSGMVIRGWEEGIPGMCVGEKRRLRIPPSMGYGGRKVGSIPANSVLLFDIELLDIEDPKEKAKPKEKATNPRVEEWRKKFEEIRKLRQKVDVPRPNGYHPQQEL